MAKKSTVVESIDELQDEVTAVESPAESPAVEAVEAPVPVVIPELSVMIELPARVLPDTHYRTRFIHVPGLTGAQADAAKALFEGLHKQQAKLANGRYVKNTPDAIRYVLEQIAGQLQF